MLNFVTENVRVGLKNLALHKLRSLLTALGIICGVMAVIIMVAIGQGAKQAAREQMEQLGATNILVRSTRPPESTDAGSSQRVPIYGITQDDIDLLETMPNIKAIVPLRDVKQGVLKNDQVMRVNTIATTPDIFDVVSLQLQRGSAFDWSQYEENARVCVLGADAAKQLFPFSDPIDQTVQVGVTGVGTLVLTVVGVLEPTGLRAGAEASNIIDREIDRDIYFPLSLADQTYGPQLNWRDQGALKMEQVARHEVWLQTEGIEYVEPTSSMTAHALGLPDRLDLQVKAPIQLLRAAEQEERKFNFIMGSIAGISLVVGGIGIMNIMLASVTERTKEIGIRRALGAKQKHITLQFLIETVMISAIGGLLGIAVGVGGALALPWIVARFFDGSQPTAVTLWSVVLSFSVSGLTGLLAGLYPAIQAARLNPIEALRRE
ncbi:MAG: ABC transporter permease [Planctomycetota bacterium]